MSEKIKINYIWDQDTFLTASKCAYDYEMKNSPKRFLGWFFIALTQFGVVAAMKKGAVGLLLISTILVVYWYFFRWSIRKKLLLKNFNKSKEKNNKFEILADDEGIHLKDVVIKWSDVNLTVSLRDGFLIYTNNTFHFFPAKAFSTVEEKSAFASLAKNNSKHYTKEI